MGATISSFVLRGSSCENQFRKWNELEPVFGDLLEFKRARGYYHWGVYVGDGNVMHFNPAKNDSHGHNHDNCESENGAVAMETGGNSESLARPGSSREFVGMAKAIQYVKGKVTIKSLEGVAGENLVRINNKLNSKHSLRTTEEIQKIRDALVDKPGLFYNLTFFNCEHFVTFVKFSSISTSSQARRIRALATCGLSKMKKEARLENEAREKWEVNYDLASRGIELNGEAPQLPDLALHR